MLQLIFHGIGDFFFQTDYQALNKKKKGWDGYWACWKHCFTYSLLFLFIASPIAIAIIFVTHFIIDRTNIVAYLIAFKNKTKINGKQLMREGQPDEFYIYEVGYGKYDISNFGFHKDRPFALSIWLYIICDNLLHIICNYIALKYF